MKKDIEKLSQHASRLRADLTATNLVLLAIAGTLSQEQQSASLKAIAALSVLQEHTAEKLQKPEVIGQLQESIQRLYSALEGAYKLQNKEG